VAARGSTSVGSTRFISTVAVDTSSNSSVRSSEASIVVAGVEATDIDPEVFEAIETDAQEKADLAQAAAINAAAADATGKANLARQLAIAASTTRTNFVLDPALNLSGAYLIAGGGIALSTSGGKNRVKRTEDTWVYFQAPAVVGRYYAGSLLLAGNPGEAYQLASSDFTIGSWCEAPYGVIPAEGEVRIPLKSTAPNAGTSIYFGLSAGTHLNVSMTEALIEEVSGPGVYPGAGYFDGVTHAPGYGSAWLGAPNESSSQTWPLLAQNSVTAETIAAGAVVAGKLAADSVLANNIKAGAVLTDKLDANAVTADKIAANAITTEKIAANAIITNKIAAGAVDAIAIAAGAVTTAKLAAGAVTADKVAAQSITAEKIALNAFSSNLIADPSFEEPYSFLPVASAPQHQWAIDGSSGAGAASRFGLPNSGLWALRMEKPAAAAYVRMRSGVFPVVPGKSYVVSMAIAKEFADTTALLYCRVAGGATAALTEKPATSLATAIPFVGDDPNTFESLDPPWIQENLYPGDLLTDGGAGVHAGAQAYNTGTTTTGVRSISGSGQVLSAASQAVSARWGTYIAFNVNQGDTYRLKLRWTGLAGTNARLRFYVDGQDFGGGGTTAHLVDNIVSAASGVTVLTPPTSAVYDTYKVYAWLEPAAGLTATSPTVTITSIEMERIDPDTGIVRPLLEMYNSLSATVTIPAGINFAAVKFVTSSGATANPQSIFVDDVSVVEVGRGGTEITAAGVRLFSGDGSEVGAFVSNRPNYLSVTRRGQTLAGISQFGDVSGQSLSIAGKDIDGDGTSDRGMEIYGTEFLDWLNQLGRGVVARGWRETSTASIAATEQPLLELQFDQIPGRQYVVHCAVPLYSTTTGTRAIIRIRGTTNGTTPGVSSTEYRGVRTAWALAGPTYWSFFHKMMGVKSGAVLDTRLLLTGDAETNSFSCPGSTTAPMEMWVEDLGPYMDDTGIDRTVTTPPVTKKTYTTTWTSIGARSYMGSGAQDSSQGPSDMKHGYSSYDGNSKSLWIFNNTWSSYLSGSTISKIRVYLYANHWYNNAGGTAYVKVHGYTSAPGSSPSMTTALTSSNWPKPGGRWVTLPSSLHAGFLSGAYKGVGVGPAPSTSSNYYGRFNRDGAKIEITYIK
jgi:hypothetical protein